MKSEDATSKRVTLALAAMVILLAVSTVYAFTSRIVLLFPTYYTVVEEKHYLHNVGPDTGGYGQISFIPEMHVNVKQWRWIDGEKYLIYTFDHPANATNLGLNYTCMKITGDSTWNLTDYMQNATFISMGDDTGTLGASSTELDVEDNRTSASFEYIGVGNYNYTASFFPSGSGTCNATGYHYRSSGDLNMLAYDTHADISYTSNDQIDYEWGIQFTND